MKRLLLIGLIAFVVIVIAQSLHRIDNPTKIDGWLYIKGDFWPLWSDKYDIGKPNFWWDSSWVAKMQARELLVWSADSVDTMKITPTGITGNAGLRGHETFAATCTVDTVTVAVFGANDFYDVTWKGATNPNNCLWCWATAGTLFVECVADDTTKARAEGYDYTHLK